MSIKSLNQVFSHVANCVASFKTYCAFRWIFYYTVNALLFALEGIIQINNRPRSVPVGHYGLKKLVSQYEQIGTIKNLWSNIHCLMILILLTHSKAQRTELVLLVYLFHLFEQLLSKIWRSDMSGHDIQLVECWMKYFFNLPFDFIKYESAFFKDSIYHFLLFFYFRNGKQHSQRIQTAFESGQKYFRTFWPTAISIKKLKSKQPNSKKNDILLNSYYLTFVISTPSYHLASCSYSSHIAVVYTNLT